MRQILYFLANEGYFLLSKCGFKFVDSKDDGMNQAMVAMSNGSLVVCFLTDRSDPMTISFIAAKDYKDHHYYPWQTIRERLTGQQVNSWEEYNQELSAEEIDLIHQLLPDIQELFASRKRKKTYQQLDEIFGATLKRMNTKEKQKKAR